MPSRLIIRLTWRTPGHTSYCELTSPVKGSACGCVRTTWNASAKASLASFQLQGTTLRTWADFQRCSSGRKANSSGRTSR